MKNKIHKFLYNCYIFYVRPVESLALDGCFKEEMDKSH